MKNRTLFSRIWAHLRTSRHDIRFYFCDIGLQVIEQAISQSELLHTGEIRFVVESSLTLPEIAMRKTPRQRALELFSHLHIWDTEDNNGVMIYLLLADRDIEIVADRGVSKQVSDARWQAICHAAELKFKQGEFEGGVLQAVAEIGAELVRFFPANGKLNPNELPNKPLVL